MQDLKLCKNCKFYHPNEYVDSCDNPIFPKRKDLVSGYTLPNYCMDLRADFTNERTIHGLCGPEARHFEKRLTWWEKLWKK